VKRDLTRGSTRGRDTVHVTASARGMGRSAHAPWRLALVTACALLAMLLLATSASAFTQTGTFGSAAPQAMSPNRLAVDEASGDIYVVDEANGVVNRFDHNGAYLSQLTGSFAFGGGGFDDVAVDNSGTATQGYVYVEGEPGSGPGTLTAFDAHGNLRWQSSSFSLLCGVAVDPTSGNLWVGDVNTGVRQRSVADGSAIGSAIDSGGLPCRIAFDASGNLYVDQLPSFGGEIDKYPPPPTDPSASTPDSGAMDVGTDSATGDLYSDQGGSVNVFDSSGTALGSSPFGGSNVGVAVDGAHRLVYLSDSSANDVQVWTMDTGSSKPFASVGTPPSPIGSTSATLNASVNPAGATTDCHFDYGTTTSYGSTAPCDSGPGSGTSDVAVTAALSGLTAGTTYHYRIVAHNSAGTVTGDDNTFTTTTPRTLNVTVVGSGTVTGSTINCTSIGGSGCTATPDSGTTVHLTATPSAGWRFGGWAVTGTSNTTCSGTTSPCDVTMDNDVQVTATFVQQWRLSVQKTGSGSGTVTDNRSAITCGATCSALFDDGASPTLTAAPDANSTFVGWSSGGCSGTAPCQVTLSADTAVTATFAQKAPDVSTGGASGVGQTAATVGGSVNPNGDTATCHFDYGTSTSYGSTAPCASAPGSGSGAVSVSASLSGLAAGTTYHYRLVATNGGGTTAGADATLTTSSAPKAPTLKLSSFSGSTLVLKLACTGSAGQSCSGKLTFKSVIKVRVKHGKKTKVVKKTITVATVSYRAAAGGTQSLKLKLTSAAKSALKSGGLTARAGSFSIKLPKTKVRAKKKH